MRILKLAVLSGIIFFLLLTAIGFLLPSHIRISRAIDIRAGRPEVRAWLSDTEKCKSWNVYLQDSAASRLQVRVTAVTDSLVLSHWEAGGKQFQSGMALYTPMEGMVTVQWYFDFRIRWYPWEKLGSIVYDRQLGDPMQESLGKLKALVETNP